VLKNIRHHVTATVPPGVRWVLFDAVGTLLYPHPAVAEAYAAAAQRHGSKLTASEAADRFRTAFESHTQSSGPTDEPREKERWRRIVAATIDDVCSDHQESLFQELWNHFAQPDHWRVYDDVPPALAELSARGCRLGIASNFDQRLAAIVAGHPSLAPCERVFVSSELGATKPSLAFFRAIEQRLSAEPTEIALIGDDPINDIEGARAAGWTAIYVER
jgi:putative hydrolase of the HAD superfamily